MIVQVNSITSPKSAVKLTRPWNCKKTVGREEKDLAGVGGGILLNQMVKKVVGSLELLTQSVPPLWYQRGYYDTNVGAGDCKLHDGTKTVY